MNMNINKNSAVQEPPFVDKRCKGVYCPELNKHWKSGAMCAEEIGVTPVAIYNVCNRVANTCKGMHFSYEENVSECQEMTEQRIDVLEQENAKLKAERDSEKELADQMRAIIAERKAEARRKYEAKQAHLKAIAETEKAIEDVKTKQTGLQHIMNGLEAQLQRAETDFAKAEQEEAELIAKLLELKGITKED